MLIIRFIKMGKTKISDAEAEVIKDAIIDALETSEEVVAEEVVLNIPAPEVESPGHHSRDLKHKL